MLQAFAEAWQWLLARALVAKSPTQSSSQAVFVTRQGRRVLDEGIQTALGEMRAGDRLGVELHPLLRHRVRRQFLMGEHELAAFAAMREVEVRVRELGGLAEGDLGVRLMRQAFGDNGRLRDRSLEPGEQQARSDLFAGALGVFKNPSSHRAVVYDDPTEAAEVVLLADLLLRLLDRAEERLQEG